MPLKKALKTGVLLLALSSLLSRVLGVFRDHLLASKFGATLGSGIYDIDTYYAAFRLPDLLYNLLIFGTISATFVPIFSEYLVRKNKDEAWRFLSTILNLILVFLLIVSGILFIFAPWLVKILVPGFSAEKLAITVNLTRIMLLSPIFFGLSSLAQSVQNAFHKYFFYSLAPIMYNLSIIFGIVFFGTRFGVYGVAVGVVVGAFLHLAIQLPAIIKLRFKYCWSFDYRRKDVSEMLRLILPRIVGVSAMQLEILVYTIIGSTLALGSISILNYAINLQSFPLGVIAVSFSIVSFATLSRLAADKKTSKFSDEIKKNVGNILFWIIPASVGLYLLRFEITALILKGGKFTVLDTFLTSQTLGFLVIGLFAQSLIQLFARAFYAMKNTKTPVLISIFSVSLSIIFALIFTKVLNFGVIGFGAAWMISALASFVVFVLLLRKKVGNVFPFGKVFRIILASFIMGIFVYFGKEVFISYFGEVESFMDRGFQVGLLSLIGTGVYFGGWGGMSKIKGQK